MSVAPVAAEEFRNVTPSGEIPETPKRKKKASVKKPAAAKTAPEIAVKDETTAESVSEPAAEDSAVIKRSFSEAKLRRRVSAMVTAEKNIVAYDAKNAPECTSEEVKTLLSEYDDALMFLMDSVNDPGAFDFAVETLRKYEKKGFDTFGIFADMNFMRTGQFSGVAV